MIEMKKQWFDVKAEEHSVLRQAIWDTADVVASPQRKPLTDEEIRNLWDGHVVPVFGKNGINPIVFARAIEAAHNIKGNT